ncbi:pyruvate kinase [Candidatus Spongiihabitans sp.]|uniref:pyruvate kinase n=1 Tax=Candidatus Spongiihabitans sp. TaxID=3101308 RepID=UPI003C7C36AE
MRKTKVIATIGPACDNVDTLKAMIGAGMNVARLNMSHGDVKAHTATLQRVRQAAHEAERVIAIMVDTRGREIRTGTLKSALKSDGVLLQRNQKFSLYADGRKGDERGVSVSYANLYRHTKPDDRILVNDGQIELIVTKVAGSIIECRVECGGVLRNTKGVNLPDNKTAFDDIPSNDAREIDFAVSNEVQYIAASFIRNASEVVALRDQIKSRGADIPIIAKIENREGVENLTAIIDAANGIMVARGDLGVELEMGQGPTIQKQIIRATVSQGKPVITATQMLDSMERNPRPTRAEVSDVANAIFDGTSAVMLSGETAVGRRPVETVQTMVRLAMEAEAGLRQYGYLQQIEPNPSNEVTEAVAQASIAMANHLNAAAIIALTETGFTSRLISKYRPYCPILAITTSKPVVAQLSMNWGVLAMHYDGDGSDEEKITFAISKAKALGYVKDNDVLILTAGNSRQAGSTDLIRVLSVK